ncbi:class F sortase [Nocardiopsis salina]|uniref:class F sortase n=1 Tax=Nocardiopsis salina TaxID=245836 RepID=UPI0003454E0D|nr:class F sortase [Nocardiopsis salina]
MSLTAASLFWVAAAGCAAAPPTDGPPPTETSRAPDSASAEEPAEPQSLPEEPAGGDPAAVRIPGIGVSSELLHLGVEDDGSAVVPEDHDLASWYDRSGRPGQTRPTVVLGHVDSADGPAVFHRLRELEDGDTVEVDTAAGDTVSYSVTGVHTFPKDAFPTFEVFGATGEDVLRLVTCTGDFDLDERSYTDNLVVFAERPPGV